MQATANQAQGYISRLSKKAGYEATVSVALRLDGGVEKIELSLEPSIQPPLMSPETLKSKVAEALNVDASLIELAVDGLEGGESGP